MIVHLTPQNLYMAAMYGVGRQVKNITAQRKDAHGAEHSAYDPWHMHITGAIGEFALAKHLGVFWDGALDNLRANDVGRFQVRTRSKHWHELPVYKSDSNADPFVLTLTHDLPDVHLVGWIMGGDAKQDVYWKEAEKGRLSYFVPQSQLHAMETLCTPSQPEKG